MTGCGSYGADCYISAYDARDGKPVWRFSTIAREGQPGGDTWGAASQSVARGRRHLDRRHLRSGAQRDLLGRGPAQALAARQPRRQARRQGAVHQFHARARSRYRQAQVVFSARAGRILRHGRSVRTRPGRSGRNGSCCSPSASPASCGSSTARPASFSAHKETVYQNLFATIDPKTGEPTYRSDILEQQIGQWFQICPSTEGGHNWQAMSYHPETAQLIIPLSQSCMAMSGRKVEFKENSGGGAGDRRFFEMPEHARQDRQAGGLRRPHAEGELVDRAARAVSDRGALDGRRSRLCRRSGPLFPGRGRQDRQDALEDAPGHVGAGLSRSRSRSPANSTLRSPPGLGGGSPRDVPRVIAPEIHHPGNGNALYVFALPDNVRP